MLLGEFRHSLDAKGRVFLPSKWRDELSEGVVVTRGLDRCLWIFPRGRFEQVAAQVQSLPVNRKKNRDMARMFFSAASEEEIDRQGRIIIPPHLREYAGLAREAVLVGTRDKGEIWDRSSWGEYRAAVEPQFESIAEDLEL